MFSVIRGTRGPCRVSTDQWSPDYIVSAKRTPSCKDSRRIAVLRHDQALKEGLDEVAKAGFRAGT